MPLLPLCLAAAAAVLDPSRPFPEYRAYLWSGDNITRDPVRLPLIAQRMEELGVNALSLGGGADPSIFTKHQIQYYVENVVNKGLCLKWNSNVRDWNAFVTRWHQEGRPESAFVREYGLHDPVWRSWGRDRMREAGRMNRAHRPVLYDIRDELSTTISANPFDYDFSDGSLERFRDILKARHGGLEELNAAWDTSFKAWAEVRPFSTDRIKHRIASGQSEPRGKPEWSAVSHTRFDPAAARKNPKAWNLAPWMEFRAFMDDSLAGALDDFRNALRAADPHGLAGVEGTQMPHAFGGYDLWKLSRSVDWLEPYDIANAREILGSFMPRAPFLATYGESQTKPALRRLWHTLLLGDIGCVVWWSEDVIDWSKPDLPLTEKGKALAPALRSMREPVVKDLLGATRLADPVYIHYSQPSIQVEWLLGSFEDGTTWHRRFSSYEPTHNRLAKVRNGWLKALQDLGYSPRFVSSAQIEAGFLDGVGDAALVLPDSLALSDREAERIRDFARAPGRARSVVWSGPPGVFDEWGHPRAEGALSDLIGSADDLTGAAAWTAGSVATPWKSDVAAYPEARLQAKPDAGFARWLSSVIPVKPAWAPSGPEDRVRIHRIATGKGVLLGVERNVDYRMSEDLSQAGGNQALESATRVTLRHPGTGKTLEIDVDPWKPTLMPE